MPGNTAALFTLFFVLLFAWLFCCVLVGALSFLYFLLGMIVAGIVSFTCWRLRITSPRAQFLFLQINFYRYVIKKLIKNTPNIFKLTFQFLNPNYKFKPILDFVFLDKDKDTEIALCVNLLTALPGSLATAIKKRYVIVHSLGEEYFNLGEMYNMSNEISIAHDDALI